MAWVSVGMGAVSVISAGQQAQLIEQQGRTQKMIDDMNADFLEIDAYHAETQGQTDVARYQTTIDQTVGSQRAAEAAAGVDVNFGTAKELQTESKITGFLNQLDIQNQAANKAYGIRNQAANLRLTGQNVASQANIDASSRLSQAEISAGASIGSSYLQNKTTIGSSYLQNKTTKRSTTGY